MRRLLRLVLPLLPLAFPAGTALAGGPKAECTREPQAHWMSREAISLKAVAAGYPDIQHIIVIGSCYEIEALTARRLQADVVMDPMTGDVVAASMSNGPQR